MNLFYNSGNIIVSVPALACSAIGTAGRWLEESSNCVVKGIGWLGSRSAIVLAIPSGTPLLVYSYALTLVANIANAVTANKLKFLSDYKDYCNKRFNAVMIAVPLVPLWIADGPELVRTAKKLYDVNKEFQKSIETTLQQSETFKHFNTLHESFLQLQQRERSTPSSSSSSTSSSSSSSTSSPSLHSTSGEGKEDSNKTSTVVNTPDKMVKDQGASLSSPASASSSSSSASSTSLSSISSVDTATSGKGPGKDSATETNDSNNTAPIDKKEEKKAITEEKKGEVSSAKKTDQESVAKAADEDEEEEGESDIEEEKAVEKKSLERKAVDDVEEGDDEGDESEGKEEKKG